MIASLLVTMFLGIGYGPPTEYDVLRVLQRQFYVGQEAFVDPVTVTENFNLQFNNFPISVDLKHCDPFETDRSRFGINALSYDRGFRCLAEVIPHAIPPFLLSGIFTYDGLDWRYHGEVVRRQLSPQETINRANTENGRIILKPGSLPYNGFPQDPFNDVPSPYDDLLRGFDANLPF